MARGGRAPARVGRVTRTCAWQFAADMPRQAIACMSKALAATAESRQRAASYRAANGESLLQVSGLSDEERMACAGNIVVVPETTADGEIPAFSCDE